MKPITLLSLALLLTSLPAAADCRVERPITMSVTTNPSERIRIDVGAGSLEVVGEAGLDSVYVEGTVCASSDELLDEMDVRVDRRGGHANIHAHKRNDDWSGSGRSYVYADLVIRVPNDAEVEIDDGSGELTVRHVRSAVIDDGSGSMRVEQVDGMVRIDDGSGNIDLRDIGGSVWIDDGSGSVTIDHAGSVEIDSDGSGDLDFTDVQGDVVVREDGSGSIRVRGVGGDFTVRRDGSGSIEHRDVLGRVSVPRD